MNNKISTFFDKGPILITGHINPDGDALGASFCLKILFDKEDIEADINFDIQNKLPSNLDHLPYHLITNNMKDSYETVFVFDCGNPSRLGKYEEVILKASNIIVIDHHIDPTFGTVQIVDSEAASTTQVLYRQLIEEGYAIDKAMARLNRWRDPNNTENPYEIRSRIKTIMQECFGVFRDHEPMQKGLSELEELEQRLQKAKLHDTSKVFNTTQFEMFELDNMMATALATARSSLHRTESRGAHSREDYPDRDDENWLSHTVYFEDSRFTTRPVNMEPKDIEPFPVKEREH